MPKRSRKGGRRNPCTPMAVLGVQIQVSVEEWNQNPIQSNQCSTPSLRTPWQAYNALFYGTGGRVVWFLSAITGVLPL